MTKYIDINDLMTKLKDMEMKEDTKNCMLEEHDKQGFYEKHLGVIEDNNESNEKGHKIKENYYQRNYIANKKPLLECKNKGCSNKFIPKSNNNKFCTSKCRMESNKKKKW